MALTLQAIDSTLPAILHEGSRVISFWPSGVINFAGCYANALTLLLQPTTPR